jgi:hypothetical protein
MGAVICLLLLALVSWQKAPISLFYALMLCKRRVQRVLGPALGALVTNIVPPEQIPAAAKFGSIRWQLAATLGGLSRAAFLSPIFDRRRRFTRSTAWDASFSALFCGRFALESSRFRESGWVGKRRGGLALRQGQSTDFEHHYPRYGRGCVRRCDGFTAMYAKDILLVGPSGLGPLRAAPAVGAIVMGIALTLLPPFKRAGWTLLFAIADLAPPRLFSRASKNYTLSLAAFSCWGALDNISVVGARLCCKSSRPMNAWARQRRQLGFYRHQQRNWRTRIRRCGATAGPVIAGRGWWSDHNSRGRVCGLFSLWPQVRRLGSLESVQ